MILITRKQALGCLLFAGACSAGAGGTGSALEATQKQAHPIIIQGLDEWVVFDGVKHYTQSDERACQRVGFGGSSGLEEFYDTCRAQHTDAKVIAQWSFHASGPVGSDEVPPDNDDQGTIAEETRICSAVRGYTDGDNTLHCARLKTEGELAELQQRLQQQRDELEEEPPPVVTDEDTGEGDSGEQRRRHW